MLAVSSYGSLGTGTIGNSLAAFCISAALPVGICHWYLNEVEAAPVSAFICIRMVSWMLGAPGSLPAMFSEM